MLSTRFRSAWLIVLAGVLSVAPLACQQPDPKNPATWVAKLNDSDPHNVADALDQLRKLKATSAVKNIEPLLKSDSGDVRVAAAYALGEIGDKSAVDSLIHAVDLSWDGEGSDRANAKIAWALGVLGSSDAVPTLIKMTSSRKQLVQLHAVEALGMLKDPRAVPVLTKFIEDPDAAPYVTKNAIVALGNMKAVSAIPDLTKALVIERHGVSFVLEASFALLQMGVPAATAVDAILDGSNQNYVKWAEDDKRIPASYMSKGPVVLGDIAAPESVPVLIKMLKWKDPGDNSVWTELVRAQAAEALGRIRATEAAMPIAEGLPKVVDANMRAKYVLALVQIGNTKVLPKLEAAARSKSDTITEREESVRGIALLGHEKELPFLTNLMKTDTAEKLFKKCMDDSGSSDDAKTPCQNLSKQWGGFMTDALAALTSGKECQDKVACWTEKLKDKVAMVRMRAAYELGRAGTEEAVKGLLSGLKDDDTHVRRAIYIGLDWATRNPATKDLMKKEASVLDAQYQADRESAVMQVVGEDIKRVAWKAHNI